MMLSTVGSPIRTPRVPTEETTAPARGAYLTKTSLVAVHFPEAGKGRIVFLPKEAMLRVIGPSSCLPDGLEVMFENRIYNVFEVDLTARSRLNHEPIRTHSRIMAACA